MSLVQKEALINFMQFNYANLYGKHPSQKGPETKIKIWKKLADILNGLGPPVKSFKVW